MTGENKERSHLRKIILGIIILLLGILGLIIALSIQFSDQSDSFFHYEIDWSVYIFLIVAISYGLISIVWYAIIDKDSEKIKEKILIELKNMNPILKKLNI